MSFRAFISFLCSSVLIIAAISAGTGCANIIPPEGGPRDSLPPVLVKATPADSTRNYTGNRVSFVFDEYVDLDNYQQNLIVSPLPKNSPTVTRKLQTITVKFRDTLEENSTYTLNFGKAIKDVNEGNIARDFTYMFSTGSFFDSLRLNGNVKIAETGEIDTTLTVMLHFRNDDSALIQDKPRYVTRVDKNGNFSFRNLPPDTFYVYALKDEGGSYRYFNATQTFAFADSAVITGKETRPISLHAYFIPKEEKETTANDIKNRKGADKRLRLSTNLNNNEQDLLSKLTLSFETPLATFDSSKLKFLTDTLFTPVTGYSWSMDTTKKKLTLNYAWKENTQYHFIFEKDFATDTLGQQLLKDDTLSFTTKKSMDYGKLSIRFRNLDLTKNPVLLFVQGNEVKAAFPLTSNTFTQALFNSGEYSMRILNDVNKNGKWDPGNFFGVRRQPELVKPVERKINVRANLDNQFDVDINAVAAPVNNNNNNRQRPQNNNNQSPPRILGTRPGNRPAGGVIEQ